MKKIRGLVLILIVFSVFLSTFSTASGAKLTKKTVRSMSQTEGKVELTLFQPDDKTSSYFNVIAVDKAGKRYSFKSGVDDMEMPLRFTNLPYGSYTLEAENKDMFVYEPEIEVNSALLKKDLFAYPRASLKIVSHGYDKGEPEYSIYVSEMDSSWTYKRLYFKPELIPRISRVKVRLTGYDKENYVAKEVEKTVNVKSKQAVVGFYFAKKQNIVKVSSFDKQKVSVKLSKAEVIKRLPAKGKLTLEDGSEREVNITWNTAEFTENKEGVVKFKGSYPAQSDLKNVMEFEIEVDRLGENSSEILIESVDKVGQIDVKFGTTKEELASLLPKTILVKLSNKKEKIEVPVKWELGTYEAEKTGIYTLKGSYTIEGVDDYPEVKVDVRVKEKEIPLTEDDFVFIKKDGRVVLKDIKPSGKDKVKKSKKLVVPGTYKGEPVVEIGSAACQWLDFEELEIPDTVEVIDFKAFGYNRLTSLVIPDSVRQIGAFAFSARPDKKEPRIKEVKISKNIEKIDEGAFGWAGFSEIKVPATLKELHKEAFYKTNGHQDTKKVHVYVDGFTNPNNLKDGITHIINPAKVSFEYRYKGQIVGTTKPSYQYKDKYYHINEEARVLPEGIPSGYELNATEVSVVPDAKEYVKVIDLVKQGERLVVREVIHQFKDIQVAYGTDKEALKQKLPSTVTIIDSYKNEHIVPVKWYLGSYDGKKPSVYKLRASFSLPEGVAQNPKSPVALEYWIKVTVKEKELERSISIEFSFTEHVGVPELYAVDDAGKEYVLKPTGSEGRFSVKVPKGKFRVQARNINEDWVPVPAFLNVNTIKQNATGIMSLEKGVRLKVKAVDEKGSTVPDVSFKTMVPILDVLTYTTTEYEYGELIPSSLEAADKVKVMIKDVPDGYKVIGDKVQTIPFLAVSNEIVFKLKKVGDLVEVTNEGRFVRIRIRQSGNGGNFVIRASGGQLVYVGVLEGKERNISLHLEDEEAGEYFVYVNVDGVVKKKSVKLQ